MLFNIESVILNIQKTVYCKKGGYNFMDTKLISQNNYVVNHLAMLFLKLDIGDNIPTISKLSEMYGVGNGTTQKALKYLNDIGAVSTVSKGAKGTILVEKKIENLLELSGGLNINGVMPLPYTKRYEGLATGLFDVLNQDRIRLSLTYIPGSDRRLKKLIENKYDFVVTSKKTASKYTEENNEIEIYSSLYKGSYITEHSLVLSKEWDTSSLDNMKVGIDVDSHDQRELTLKFFDNKNAKLIPVKYDNILGAIESGFIDGAIWSEDGKNIKNSEIMVKKIDISSHKKEETMASILIKKDNYRIKEILKSYFDTKLIKKIQKEVLNGKRLPNY